MNFDELDKVKVEAVRQKVDIDSDKLQEIVDNIIQPYCQELDKYIDFVKDILSDGEKPPTDSELDDFCLNISVYIYYASSMQEQLGIKDDIAKALYKEMYNNCRQTQDKGTISDKDSLAELASQQEYLTSVCYKRAYSIVKAKVAASQEILSSVKKVISRRMSEKSLTQIGGM